MCDFIGGLKKTHILIINFLLFQPSKDPLTKNQTLKAAHSRIIMRRGGNITIKENPLYGIM
jgi:hypothetical protein